MWLWFIKSGAEHWSRKAWVICWKDLSSTHLDGRVQRRCHCLDSFCPASKVPVIRVPRSTRAGHRLRRRGCPTHYCWRKKLMINHSKHARAHNTRCAQVLAQLRSCFEGGFRFSPVVVSTLGLAWEETSCTLSNSNLEIKPCFSCLVPFCSSRPFLASGG